ncbi:hypothetical protein O1L60_35345 [Streptomyces diastatochromogenes]|nr:hypothetical protein [Streptomyces diastatochromogenes]
MPDRATATYDVRARTSEELAELQARVRACFEAGALATGAELLLETVGNDYADLRQDLAMGRSYQAAAEALGRTVLPNDPGLRGGSTDMGNVSHLVPTIHPSIGYDCGDTIMHHRTSPGTGPRPPPTAPSSTAASPWRGPRSTWRPTPPSASGSSPGSPPAPPPADGRRPCPRPPGHGRTRNPARISAPPPR